ncbi:hypothetical protein LguiA_033302 [Lonicera macranthoides]
MGGNELKWRNSISRSSMSSVILVWSFLFFAYSAVAERRRILEHQQASTIHIESNLPDQYNLLGIENFLWKSNSNQSGYQHVWPDLKFGWKIIVGTIIGFFGAAFGSVGGVSGGGIFVPMLTLIIRFDAKSATALSKCMITSAAISTVYYNLKLRHPTIDIPIIDYDLVLLVQPMVMMGISFGVSFNVIFADWMVTILLIVLFLVISTKTFFKGVEIWKKENVMKEEAKKRLTADETERDGVDYKLLPGGPSNENENKDPKKAEVTILENVRWKEFGLLAFVWVVYLAVQITMNNVPTCSTAYWVVNCLQIPVSIGISLYEAIGLYKGRKVLASKGDAHKNLNVQQLILYCSCGFLAGVVGGLLGLGGGFIMGPLFLELGIPPEVASATATFGMTWSASMSVIEYFLLKRFPIPYAIYLVVVAAIAAFIGQHAMGKLVKILGRASLIIFVVAFTIFVSAIALGGVGISNMIRKIELHEYMGFENLCTYDA